jgi:hypothetical protein
MDQYETHGYTELVMTRCLQCEATMTAEEMNCINCGASKKPKSEKTGGRYRFRQAVTIMFFASALLSLVALFTDYGPPFMTSIAVTLVLLLVKSSADEMVADVEK